MGKESLRICTDHMGQMLRWPLAWTLLVLTGAAGAAAQSANPPQAPGTPPQFEIKVERNTVVVAVVVRDAKGAAVGGLHKEDFQLLDNGEAQEITGFNVEVSKPQPALVQPSQAAPAVSTATPPPPPAAAPERFVAFFIDDVHGKPEEYWRSRDAAWRFVGTSARPQDHLAVFSTSGKHQVDFTGDQVKIHDALFHLSFRGPHSAGCPEVDEYEAYLATKEQSSDALAVLHAEALQCTCGAGSGESADMPNPMQERPSMMQNLGGGNPHDNCRRGAERDAENKANAVWSASENLARHSLQALENTVNRLAAMPGQKSLVLISSGFLSETQEDKIDAMINHALRREVVISSIYAPGLEAAGSGESAAESRQLAPRLAVAKGQIHDMSLAHVTSAMANLSAGTGGTFFYNDNDFDGAIRRAAAVPEVLYVLTFSPRDFKLDGKFHTLKVTLNASGHFAIQARRGYFASKTTLVGAAERSGNRANSGEACGVRSQAKTPSLRSG